MSGKIRPIAAPAILGALFLALPYPVLSSAADGWVLSGTSPESYEVGTVRSDHGSTAAFLRSAVESPDGFGTLMQTISADGHREQRIRMSGAVMSRDVSGWAAMWLRVDGVDSTPLSFDNMRDRPIVGSTDWQPYEIVLDIPGESMAISFGLLLVGTGEVRLDELEFEIVGDDVMATDGAAAAPAGFDEKNNRAEVLQ